jgi:hypothetical protein
MARFIRKSLVVVGLLGVLAAGGWTVTAQERHPVLRHSIRQLEGIKDHLQKAPTDFGGHKAAAIEAINRAMNELREAIEYDKK